jgi:phthalate 4,5-cis-dihydrodiol dehydrogenase
MIDRPLRLGVAGLGRGFMLMLPTFVADRRIALAAAADLRPEARERFVRDFGGTAYDTVEALCRDASIEAVYVATPHQMHARHAVAAARAGKHVLVEKPVALTLDEARAMVGAAHAAGVHLVVGHSHSFDAPIAATHALIASGAYGRVRQITALNYTDFLYRPRRPEELDTGQGGGVVLSQAAHQVDIVRLLAGGMALSVRAATGAWDPARPTEGAYAAFIAFAEGVAATITYSGYDRFDSDELCGWIGETGMPKDPAPYGAARAQLRQTPEAVLKRVRSYGVAEAPGPARRRHEHFGMVIATCERADLRPLPEGVMIYGDEARALHELAAPTVPRVEVIDEIYGAVRRGRTPLHRGEWGLATLEVCLAILRSAREGSEVPLAHQVPP